MTADVNRQHAPGNRRERNLTEEDIAELLRRMDEADEARWASRMETIGLDVTTPASRKAIADNNSFVTDFRTGAARAKMAAWGAGISTFVGASLYMLWLTLKTALTAKGAG